MNRFSWVRKQITPDYPVVTPNATTLYGAGFLDLRAGPVVIEVPEITDRYFSVQIMDQYGIFRMIVGSPFNGTRHESISWCRQGSMAMFRPISRRRKSCNGRR